MKNISSVTAALGNGLVYGFVRDYEMKAYQVTPIFVTNHKCPKPAETRMHYTRCCTSVFIKFHSSVQE